MGDRTAARCRRRKGYVMTLMGDGGNAAERAVATPGARPVLFCVLTALALRIPGLFHDFWLDEVWSYWLVRQLVASPADILTRLHIDNNHPLNSWFLYVLGDRNAWFWYRVPSLLMGIGAVLVAGRIMSRRGPLHGLLGIVLLGCSYPLIVYSSEARGYAPLVFFTLLTIEAHERLLTTPGPGIRLCFYIAVILGWLSHLSFLHAYAAVLLWSAYAMRQRHQRWRDVLQQFAGYHAIPLLFLTGLYLIFVRHLRIAGAEPASLLDVLASTVALAIGAPESLLWAPVVALACIGLFAWGCATISKAHGGLCLVFLAGILLVPGCAVLIQVYTATTAPRFFPRYFLVSVTLFLLLLSWLTADLLQSGGARKLLGIILLALYTTGSLWQVAHFLAYGRGHYHEALTFMAHHGQGAEIRVSSNSDFRTMMLLRFYRRTLPPGKHVIYYTHQATRQSEVEWRLIEDLASNAPVAAVIDNGPGAPWQLVQRFPFYGLSGCQWSLYRRPVPPASTADDPATRVNGT